jgi:hypothetical protein
VRR